MLAVNFNRLESIAAIALATSLILLGEKEILAQIASDGTTNTQTNVSESLTTITGGAKTGQNLFHSFEQFSLSEGAAAYFNNSTEIENIFSRVTGGSISEIDGLIRANGNASLFIVNPAGIIFGANAQLNLGGSFIATTSESIIFEDGSQYSAVQPLDTPLLTISAPVGLQYGSASGAISSSAEGGAIALEVTPGNNLALIGNDVSLAGTNFSVISGKIQIGSVASGRVNLSKPTPAIQTTAGGTLSSNGNWNLDYAEVTKFGQLDLSQSIIDTSGVGGVVSLRGEAIALSDAIVSNFTLAEGSGGKIDLLATNVIQIKNSFLATQVGSNFLNNSSEIAGNGGDILVAAPQVKVIDGSLISSGTLSLGKGGNIFIQATEFVELSGNNPSFITTSTQGSGMGGKLTVNTGKLIVRNGSQLQALAGQGNGGAIAIDAKESVELSGTGSRIIGDSETTFNSGLFASSGSENVPFELQPDGKSGDLIVNTPKLSIADSARISVSNFGAANAGNIRINAARINLTTAGEIVANTASGKGGSIALNSEDLVILQQEAQISTNAERNGNGGNIELVTDNLVLLDASKIAADAQVGTGGNIEIETRGYFIDLTSQITASSSFGTDGIVEIVTPDADSNFATAPLERSPLTAESYITTGCGAGEDFAKNQFRNVGRGGLPPDYKERTSTELWEDLGFARTSSDTVISTNNFAPDNNKIVEATDWVINSSGKVELVATKSSSVVTTASCQL
ncbi:filamentous hemagglutinin N-terminal domain-containing protein [Myxosarcina sp. GI1]|uniref:two-partner secretion domain-containing protein n=1 Tax=Myxosarcina sp. GI1 TaxID=1541065 RepID=UPI0005661556|nr:filamentous hemagglutinin N-terminal domain-containing protein [Myxosarcina sp. GI1]